MVLFNGHHPVLQHSGGLVADGSALGQVHAVQLDGLASGVEQEQKILQSGIRGKMHSICFEHRRREAWQEEQIPRTLVDHDGGEAPQHVGDPVTVPQGVGSIHRRANDVHTLRTLDARLTDLVPELHDDGLNAEGGGR